jgi:thiamine-phosphate pyrophosphorylase
VAESEPCRLYLQLPDAFSSEFDGRFAQASAYAGSVLFGADAGEFAEPEVRRLIRLAHQRDLACLVEQNAELAQKVGADGVHILADEAIYTKARALLGKDASIGVACGTSRHAAMQLAEMGADYVAFAGNAPDEIDAIDQCAELIAWWAEIFVVPCVAWNIRSVTDAVRLARLGADFVAPSKEIWREDGAAERIAEMARAVREVRKAA